MASKPRVVVFSIIPKLGDLVKQMLPQENIRIVAYRAKMSEKYGRIVSDEEVSQLRDAEILLADNNALIQFTDRLPHLKWFQGTWAGVEDLMAHFRGKSPPHYLMSRMSNETFSQLMSEYVVGQVITHERGWREAALKQAESKWHHSGKVAEYRSLRELTIALLGVGKIGQEIGRSLKAFRCRVLAYSFTPRSAVEVQRYADAHYTGDNLASILGESDYIVSCLPSTPITSGLLSAAMLQAAKPGSMLINVGRGSVVSEEDLLAALDNGPLGAAVLDVFNEEPLPPSSPLWTHPKVVVTPHCAAVSRAQDVAGTFVSNYQRFTAGQDPEFLIDVTKNY
ncbi:D-isomer specific 2-hydroxyacid dehydrogenase NAD-binding domain [Trinorchestia longiramus]|nr:D-isomer specific 2-hydroxyacid dehydrogenase NAD-binding domain [Trinorchestia longiramus]